MHGLMREGRFNACLLLYPLSTLTPLSTMPDPMPPMPIEGGIKGENMPGFNWKDRLAIKPYNIGERGGLRFISYHNPAEAIIIPALIYAKSNMANPPNKLLIETISGIRHWLDSAGS
ncbi:MAG: hypothetical protein P4L55_22455 [Syntrophobacteraceae bacterium]|nr:hypothetical protein [Syntrophobacteraceae bacterium]